MGNVCNSGRRLMGMGITPETMIPKISVKVPDDYARNARHETGAITYEFGIFNYDCGIRLFADAVDAEEVGSWAASSRLMRSCSVRRWH